MAIIWSFSKNAINSADKAKIRRGKILVYIKVHEFSLFRNFYFRYAVLRIFLVAVNLNPNLLSQLIYTNELFLLVFIMPVNPAVASRRILCSSSDLVN